MVIKCFLQSGGKIVIFLSLKTVRLGRLIQNCIGKRTHEWLLKVPTVRAFRYPKGNSYIGIITRKIKMIFGVLRKMRR